MFKINRLENVQFVEIIFAVIRQSQVDLQFKFCSTSNGKKRSQKANKNYKKIFFRLKSVQSV